MPSSRISDWLKKKLEWAARNRLSIASTFHPVEGMRAIFDRYDLHAVTIGRVIAEPVVRASAGAGSTSTPTAAS